MWSLAIPRVGAIHFEGLFRITGSSKCCANKNVLHYGKKTLIGITVLNGLGEPNNFNHDLIPVGYSRKIKKTKIVHYNRQGRPISYTRCFGFVLIHRGRITNIEGLFSVQPRR